MWQLLKSIGHRLWSHSHLSYTFQTECPNVATVRILPCNKDDWKQADPKHDMEDGLVVDDFKTTQELQQRIHDQLVIRNAKRSSSEIVFDTTRLKAQDICIQTVAPDLMYPHLAQESPLYAHIAHRPHQIYAIDVCVSPFV